MLRQFLVPQAIFHCAGVWLFWLPLYFSSYLRDFPDLYLFCWLFFDIIFDIPEVLWSSPVYITDTGWSWSLLSCFNSLYLVNKNA